MDRDYVERRIVIEYGRRYVYLYMTTGDGKLIAGREESFRQMYLLDRKEAHEEATELWDLAYDHLNDIVNLTLQEGAEGEEESGEED
jgi:hypothetical protein